MIFKILLNIFIAIFFFNVLISAENNFFKILNKTENSVNILINNKNKSILQFSNKKFEKIFSNVQPKQNTNNIIIIDYKKDSIYNYNLDENKEYNFNIKNLKNATEYYFGMFIVGNSSKMEENEFYHFFTLDKEPTEQAKNIAFKNVTESEIELTWLNGNGKNRIVVINKNSEPDLPVDGKLYIASNDYQNKSNSLNGTASKVIFNGNNKNQNNLLITNLEFGTYYFQVFEYNGNNESINYLTTKNNSNPRFKKTLLPPPIALEATNISEDGFIANWKGKDEIESYLIDIAEDKDFKNILQLYNSADLGKTTSFEFGNLEKGKTYYYRITAISQDNKSKFSNLIQVKLKN